MTTEPRPTYEAMFSESVKFSSDNGDLLGGYMARPVGPSPFPGVIVIHEVFGLVEHTKELARKFAANGYIAIAPNLYYREAGAVITEEKLVAIRAGGGIPDARVIQDLEGAAKRIRSVDSHNGKVGCIGYCSGGRQTLLFACNTKTLSAAVDCYGGRVITDELTARAPKAVINMIADLNCPVLGLFGEADQNPSPAHVKRLDEELTKHHREHEFLSYPGDVGHGFFADYRPSYRQAAAVDGWQKIFDFYGRHLK